MVQTVLEQGGSFAGINRKVQIKPLKWSQPEEGSTEEPRVTEALLILKHGGVLTHAGRQQARPALLASLMHKKRMLVVLHDLVVCALLCVCVPRPMK